MRCYLSSTCGGTEKNWFVGSKGGGVQLALITIEVRDSEGIVRAIEEQGRVLAPQNEGIEAAVVGGLHVEVVLLSVGATVPAWVRSGGGAHGRLVEALVWTRHAGEDMIVRPCVRLCVNQTWRSPLSPPLLGRSARRTVHPRTTLALLTRSR